MTILSDRAGRTSRIVVLPASTEDPNKAPAGAYRIVVWLGCFAIFMFFGSMVVLYYWRRASPGVWTHIPLPATLWLSTAIIAASSATFELARRAFGRGDRSLAARLMGATAALGTAFLISQVSSWWVLIERGAYASTNPYSGFFYLFTFFHAAHLVGGLVAIAVVLLGRSTRREVVDMATFYWHFLGVLWAMLFTVLST